MTGGGAVGVDVPGFADVWGCAELVVAGIAVVPGVTGPDGATVDVTGKFVTGAG